MVRQVYFRSIAKPAGAGAYGAQGITGYMDNVLYTSPDHSLGGDIMLHSPNVEITVPENWGASTQSMVEESDDAVDEVAITQRIGTYYTQLGDPIDLNILFKSHGNIDTYYKLRDRFQRLWGAGEFTLIIKTGDYHGGKQCINGYISSFTFDEFRSQNDVIGTATFTPITPWFFTYGNSPSVLVPFEKCPTIGGTAVPTDDGFYMINTRYVGAYRIRIPITDKDTPLFKFNHVNTGDPMDWQTSIYNYQFFDTVAHVEHTATNIDSFSIYNNTIYARDVNSNIITSLTMPSGLLGFGLPAGSQVGLFDYAEAYSGQGIVYE